MMFLFIDALHVERIEIKLQAIANPTGRDKLQILEKSDLYNTFICIFLFSVKNWITWNLHFLGVIAL